MLAIAKFVIANIVTLPVISSKLSPLLNKPLHQQLIATDKEIVSVKREQLSVSPQDQYAKWTKLNRKLDQLNSDRENILKQNDALISDSQKWIKKLNFVIFTLTLWCVRLWYRKLDLFYLPNDTFPGLVLYALSFPSGKRGVLKIGQWLFSLNLVMSNLYFVYTALIKPLPSNPADKNIEITEENETSTIKK